MKAPTESGWYWARYEINWEVVYYSHSMNHVLRSGDETDYKVFEFAEWGELIERKEPDAQPDNSVLDALKAYEKANDEMFAQCLSNGLFDAWGRPVDCTLLNAAHQLARAALSRLTP